MLKYYEPEKFDNDYKQFLKGKIGISQEMKNSGYIDPDIVAHVGKTDFYNDLTDFLNGREEECIKEEQKRYYFLPPKKAPKTQKWLEEHKNMGKLMDEEKITVVSEDKRFFLLTSDQFGFSAAETIYEENKKDKYPLSILLYQYGKEGEEQEIINRITRYVKNTRTIGGSILWPVPLEGSNQWNYNTRRGVRGYLEDRVDLTLLEIKHALDGKYEKKECTLDILYGQYKNENTYMKQWLDHFGSFKRYVEYFMLEPFRLRVPEEGNEDYDYRPVNIIDGSIISYDVERRKKIKGLGKNAILNMLDRLEYMILARSANMEKAIERYRNKDAEKK